MGFGFQQQASESTMVPQSNLDAVSNLDPHKETTCHDFMNIFLVGGFNHLEKSEFVNGKGYPIYCGKIKSMFETTNQISSHDSCAWPMLDTLIHTGKRFTGTKKWVRSGINNWLLVSTPLQNMKVSWGDYSQYMEK